MSAEAAEPARATKAELQEFVAKSDYGVRRPQGVMATVLIGTALAWALFQVWIASPFPFLLKIGILNDTQARAVHLAFAVFLTFLSYPAFARSSRDRIPLTDLILAVVAAGAALYLAVHYRDLAHRPGMPIAADLIAGGIGIVLLLEATRRAIGLPLAVMACLFLIYTFAGPWMPEVIAHKGQSLARTLDHQWLGTDGVFGIAIGVSTSFVFLYVVFGSLLDKAGAGNYFIKVAFSLLGHMRGGPAKAAILSSMMTGMISGSSVANVVTTGTFTIPLMKRVGLSPVKAGAIDTAAGTDGQIMPPIMGAAAFLMVEYVGMEYSQIIKHAFLPAVLSYFGLIVMVHIEAVRAGIEGLPRDPNAAPRTVKSRLIGLGLTVSGLLILAGLVRVVGTVSHDLLGVSAIWLLIPLLLVGYVLAIRDVSRQPEIDLTKADIKTLVVPRFLPTFRSGTHYLLPVVALLWCLVAEGMSPGLSAFWAMVAVALVLGTQKPLLAYFKGQPQPLAHVAEGLREVVDGLILGARNMVGIGVATACAGIIVGTVSLTGIGLQMTELVETISGGSLILMLVFTAFVSLVLGMGLPTTANYIVVSALAAPVIVELGAQNGLILPLIAVHLFVFYFGIMADVHPPVGLAAIAASAISGADPVKTGIQAFIYSLRTAILPFMFVFNTKLIMIGITGPLDFVITVVAGCAAMTVFAAGSMGWFVVRSRLWESVVLVAATVPLICPDPFLDMISPKYRVVPLGAVVSELDSQPVGRPVRLTLEGADLFGKQTRKIVEVQVQESFMLSDRFRSFGIVLSDQMDDRGLALRDVVLGSKADRAGIQPDWRVTALRLQQDQLPRELIFLFPLFLTGGVAVIQSRRRRQDGASRHSTVSQMA